MADQPVRATLAERPPSGIEGRRRDQIESVASALFRERGYAATGMREIARALQLQGASLYSHIGSKEEVLFAIVERAADRFEAAVDSYRDGADAGQRLRSMIRAHVEVVTGNLEAATVYLGEWRFLGPDRRARILARRDAYEQRFREAIADGVAAGTFRPVDERLAARGLLSALNGIAGWWHPDGPLSATEVADAYADLHLAGLLLKPAAEIVQSTRKKQPRSDR